MHDIVYRDVLVGWELLGDERDFADVLIVTAKIFRDLRKNLFPSF